MVTAEELCKEWKELINTPDGRQNAIKGFWRLAGGCYK
jgi:hypothetical protein